MLKTILERKFLFEELVKRDFNQKYKRTVLGMGWSIISPLFQLLIMRLVFTQFFGRTTSYYTTYIFAGNIVFAYFKESTTGGMNSLMANAKIFTKINIPKYLFLLSKNVSSLINFGLTLCVFFIFAALDGIQFTWRFILLIYPILCMILFNIGTGLILSALFVFFRDIAYLYDIFTLAVMYLSAIFYTVDSYSAQVQKLFLLNPIFVYIKYFRVIVINASVPSLSYHILCAVYSIIMCLVGGWIYKKYNRQFLYYV